MATRLTAGVDALKTGQVLTAYCVKYVTPFCRERIFELKAIPPPPRGGGFGTIRAGRASAMA